MRQFHRQRRVGIVSFVGITYSVASRHFASTIFADQILIVGWRLSKEAWSPVGSLSATRCTNALAFFLLFLFLLLSLLLAPSRISPQECDVPRRSPRVSLRRSGVRATRMLIASSYQNVIIIVPKLSLPLSLLLTAAFKITFKKRTRTYKRSLSLRETLFLYFLI